MADSMNVWLKTSGIEPVSIDDFGEEEFATPRVTVPRNSLSTVSNPSSDIKTEYSKLHGAIKTRQETESTRRSAIKKGQQEELRNRLHTARAKAGAALNLPLHLAKSGVGHVYAAGPS